MGDLKLNGATSGTVTLTPAAVAGTNTITLPASTGTMALTASPTFTGTVTATTITSPAATALTIQSAGTTAMTVSTAQKILIGTTTAASGGGVVQTIVGQGSNDGGIQLTSGTGVSGGGMAINSVAGGGVKFFGFTGNAGSETYTENMRIDSSGNLLVGQTSNWTSGLISTTAGNSNGISARSAASASGYSAFIARTDRTDCNLTAFYFGTTQVGSITTNTSSTAYNTSSDYRLKENVVPMTNGLATIASLNPVTYDWISDKSPGEGFIAHELQAFIPFAVTGEKDAVNEDGSIRPQGVDYSKIVVHLVAACQELSAKNDALEARLAALEAK